MNKTETGLIVWTDLTVTNAVEIKDFYSKVAGWKAEPLSMGDYDDFVMLSPQTNSSIAGICHAKEGNSNFPAQWMIYLSVDNLEHSISACLNSGGTILIETKLMGEYGKYCVIKDPAGAVCALYEQLNKVESL